jgi:hypothetical protein
MQTHFCSEQEMLQEKCLHSCQYTTRASLILVDAILDILVKVEALLPGVVQMAFAILEQELVDA